MRQVGLRPSHAPRNILMDDAVSMVRTCVRNAMKELEIVEPPCRLICENADRLWADGGGSTSMFLVLLP